MDPIKFDGRCCWLFGIMNLSPDELKLKLKKFEEFTPEWEDTRKMILMLKYLGNKKHKLPEGFLAKGEEDQLDADGFVKGEFHGYTCRNLDRNTGECTIYDNRPKICQRYGEIESNPCEYSSKFCNCGVKFRRNEAGGAIGKRLD